jgi:uncharacterized membrane protein YjfL (UPF0719 family)
MNLDALLVLLGGLIIGCSIVLLSTFDKAYSDATMVVIASATFIMFVYDFLTRKR